MSKQSSKTYQLLLVKQDRVLVNFKKYLFLSLANLEFLIFTFGKNGSVGRWETKHFIGMA